MLSRFTVAGELDGKALVCDPRPLYHPMPLEWIHVIEFHDGHASKRVIRPKGTIAVIEPKKFQYGRNANLDLIYHDKIEYFTSVDEVEFGYYAVDRSSLLLGLGPYGDRAWKHRGEVADSPGSLAVAVDAALIRFQEAIDERAKDNKI